jgi:hypothetical protein
MNILLAEPVSLTNDNENQEQTIVEDNVYDFYVEFVDDFTFLIRIVGKDTGLTYQKYIKSTDDWYRENMMSFHGLFKNAFKLFHNCLVKKDHRFTYHIVSMNKSICLNIKYGDVFNNVDHTLDIPINQSENGYTYDLVVSCQNQINAIRDKVTQLITYSNTQASSKELFSSNGNCIYKGDIVDKKRHGKGTEYCDTTGRIVYEGEFNKGYYHGQGTYYIFGTCLVMSCGSGNKSISGRFLNGLIHGVSETKSVSRVYYELYDHGELIHSSSNRSDITTVEDYKQNQRLKQLKEQRSNRGHRRS